MLENSLKEFPKFLYEDRKELSRVRLSFLEKIVNAVCNVNVKADLLHHLRSNIGNTFIK